MIFSKPIITDLGYEMSTRAFFEGGNITMKAVHLGAGIETEAPKELTELVDYIMEADIVKYEKQSKSVKLLFTFDNANLDEGFNWSEYGVIAEYNDGNGNTTEGLFCYGYDSDEQVNVIPKFTGENSYFKSKYSITIAVGDADNITVDLREFTDFAPQEDFDEHIEDFNNPHQVTKEQVGLGNVPNVSTNDQIPTFEQASSRDNIESGEKMSVILGKIKKIIADVISHLSANNPDGITPTKIGAAAATHSHSASNITSGTLGIARGGTGASSAVQARANLGLSGVGNQLYNHSGLVSANADRWKSLVSITLPPGTWLVNCIVDAYYDTINGYIEMAIGDVNWNNGSVNNFSCWEYAENYFTSGVSKGRAVFFQNISSTVTLYLSVHSARAMQWYGTIEAFRII